MGGCATAPVGIGFAPLAPSAAKPVLARMAASTSGWEVVRFAFDITAVVPADRAIQTLRAQAQCAWQPGTALRVRISKFGVTAMDLLYVSNLWYLTDEVAERVYVCDRVDLLRVGTIPPVFFHEMQQLPQGWWQARYDGETTLSESPTAYRLEERAPHVIRTLEIEKTGMVPYSMSLQADDGVSFSAAFTRVDTNVTRSPALFAPQLTGYTVRDLRKK